MLLAFFTFVIATCLVALMAVFLGVSSHLLALVLTVQSICAVFAGGVFFYFTARMLQRLNFAELVAQYRTTIPNWIWFIFWSINSLMIAGIAAIFLANWASYETVHPLNHAPLVCAIMSTLAILAQFVADRYRTHM